MRKAPLVFTILVLATLATANASAQDPGWIGVTIRDGREAGVEVQALEPDSPAERAGVQVGDRIVEFNAMPVVGVRQLTRIITETPVGRTVSMTVVRNGEERALQITPESRPRRFRFRIPRGLPSLSDLEDRIRSGLARVHIEQDVAPLGFQTDRLTAQLRQFFGVDPGRGALVTSVEADSPAWDAGIRAGDVIVAVDGTEVGSPGDVIDELDWDRETVTLTIVRDRTEQDIQIALPASG
jgi:serine protease Do